MGSRIFGEEKNVFTNKLNESIEVEVLDDETRMTNLLCMYFRSYCSKTIFVESRLLFIPSYWTLNLQEPRYQFTCFLSQMLYKVSLIFLQAKFLMVMKELQECYLNAL